MLQTNSCCFALSVSNGSDKKCCSAAVVVQAVSGALPGLTRFCNYALPAACLDHLLPNNAEFSPLMYEMPSNLQIHPQPSLFKLWEPLFLCVGLSLGPGVINVLNVIQGDSKPELKMVAVAAQLSVVPFNLSELCLALTR